MNGHVKSKKEKGKSESKTGVARRRPTFLLSTFTFLLCASAGCQQRMAEQPYQRPFSRNAMFPSQQSARPLEKGVVHRNQPLDDDPLVSYLTPEGRKARGDVKASAEASFDPKSIVAPLGAPEKPEYFVKEFPFALTEADLLRGQTLFNSNCALCHGGAGYGNGKIAERGLLRPPSYHVDPNGKLHDWSTLGEPSEGAAPGEGLPMGYSRGFYRWGQKIAIRDVPVGYIYMVIEKGYGGMASHAVQLADPSDRWRVIGYIRALQLSQRAAVGDLPESVKKDIGKAPATDKHGEAH